MPPAPQLIIEYSSCSRPRTTCWRQSREPERWSPGCLAAFPPGIRADRQKASYYLITAVISARKKSVVGKECTLTGQAGQAVICLPQQAVTGCGSWQNTGNLRQVLATPTPLSMNWNGAWEELRQASYLPPPPLPKSLAGVQFLELSAHLVSPFPGAHPRASDGTALNQPLWCH